MLRGHWTSESLRKYNKILNKWYVYLVLALFVFHLLVYSKRITMFTYFESIFTVVYLFLLSGAELVHVAVSAWILQQSCWHWLLLASILQIFDIEKKNLSIWKLNIAKTLVKLQIMKQISNPRYSVLLMRKKQFPYLLRENQFIDKISFVVLYIYFTWTEIA